ncbi:hypothetical protein [Parendozoicomonas sp. Alg238-R29]|uniref:hypothetical protein n=1 Tax=Parendozoicomonas sp. Alg238-R29 TaxID=2993446 RepID=UPI00248EC9B5|nr:hypothetical protein [Parendozoicomonas sp. Alg238-R29]
MYNRPLGFYTVTSKDSESNVTGPNGNAYSDFLLNRFTYEALNFLLNNNFLFMAQHVLYLDQEQGHNNKNKMPAPVAQ